MSYIRIFFFFCIGGAILSGCDSSEKKSPNTKSPRVRSISKIESPRNGSAFTIGDTIELKVSSNDPEVTIDSVSISINGEAEPMDGFVWNSASQSVGKKSLMVTVYLSNGTSEKKRHTLTLKSDVAPIRYTYRITNTFVHDPDAFTEGLLFDGKHLYESTGERGFSTLRQVELKTGKVLKQNDISSQYFGEGIGIVKDKIYMLSWKERTGFIFDKNSFEQIGQFAYDSEGWGMTSKQDTLIMSDGTQVIRFMDPEGFSELRRIEVYDQNGPIGDLNELEYVNGDLLAVRWQTEMIYIIDPANGKVKGIINLAGIFDVSLYDRRIDVLNGIAYNAKTNRYYVTGKWWPKLFEIQLITANNI